MAGSIGGYNAHSANIVAAIFIATGQVQILCSLLFKVLVQLYWVGIFCIASSSACRIVMMPSQFSVLTKIGFDLYPIG